MPHLPLLVFSLVLVAQLVSWIGKSVLQESAFSLYSRTFLSFASSRQKTLRSQVLANKRELAATSSQDEFARWAKLKRKVDKSLADLEKINNSLTSAKTGFAVKFSSALWLLTTGAQLGLVWWYRKQPMFWLPKGWVPGPVAWLLSFPSAPTGSVSVGAWSAVCKRVLLTSEEIFKELLMPAPAPVLNAPFPAQQQRQEAKIEQLGIEHEKLD